MIAVCTIVAKPLLAHARVLAESVRRHNPGVRVFALLADEVDGWFEPGRESFELVSLSEIGLPADAHLAFRYAQQPFSYACTPFLVAHLLALGCDRVVFLKQETMVFGPLTPIVGPLADAPIVLTPHFVAPLRGADAPEREINILLSGVYNLGVLGVSSHDTARRFLAWWQDRLITGCRHDVAGGMHFEQRWVDLTLSYFEGARVLRDAVCNTGHWNLPDRAVTVAGDGAVSVDGRRAAVVRFSGFDPDVPEAFTRYNQRVAWRDAGDAHVVFERFRTALRTADFEETRHWPYAYGQFDNGVPVPGLARLLYGSLADAAARFGDPFRTGGDSYYRWLTSPADGTTVSNLWMGAYRQRPDLRQAFPDLAGEDGVRFMAWARHNGLTEHQVSEALLAVGSS